MTMVHENKFRSSSEADVDLSRLPEGRLEEIQQVFKVLGIEKGTYQGATELGKQLQKASKLQYEGIVFTTSGSTSSPPETK